MISLDKELEEFLTLNLILSSSGMQLSAMTLLILRMMMLRVTVLKVMMLRPQTRLMMLRKLMPYQRMKRDVLTCGLLLKEFHDAIHEEEYFAVGSIFYLFFGQQREKL